MQPKLTVRSFNGILMKFFPKEKQRELLGAELVDAFKLKVQLMENLVDILNLGEDFTETLRKVNNVNANLDEIGKMIDELERGEEDGSRCSAQV